jgi:hypothetical protein
MPSLYRQRCTTQTIPLSAASGRHPRRGGHRRLAASQGLHDTCGRHPVASLELSHRLGPLRGTSRTVVPHSVHVGTRFEGHETTLSSVATANRQAPTAATIRSVAAQARDRGHHCLRRVYATTRSCTASPPPPDLPCAARPPPDHSLPRWPRPRPDPSGAPRPMNRSYLASRTT